MVGNNCRVLKLEVLNQVIGSIGLCIGVLKGEEVGQRTSFPRPGIIGLSPLKLLRGSGY